MRVPFNTWQEPAAIFTTHDPDTGARANADSTPTVAVRSASYPFSVISAAPSPFLNVANPATGFYIVYFDEAPSTNFYIQESLLLEIQAVVGGVAQVICERVDFCADAQVAWLVSWAGETATTFRIAVFTRGGVPVGGAAADGDFVGCLLHGLQTSEVRRIVSSVYVSGGTYTVTVDQAFGILHENFLVIAE